VRIALIDVLIIVSDVVLLVKKRTEMFLIRLWIYLYYYNS